MATRRSPGSVSSPVCLDSTARPPIWAALRASATGAPTTLCDQCQAGVRTHANRIACLRRRMWSSMGLRTCAPCDCARSTCGRRTSNRHVSRWTMALARPAQQRRNCASLSDPRPYEPSRVSSRPPGPSRRASSRRRGHLPGSRFRLACIHLCVWCSLRMTRQEVDR